MVKSQKKKKKKKKKEVAQLSQYFKYLSLLLNCVQNIRILAHAYLFAIVIQAKSKGYNCQLFYKFHSEVNQVI